MAVDLPLEHRARAAGDGAGRRLFRWLTGHAVPEEPEVREALLMTMPEPRYLMLIGLFWTQAVAWAAFASSPGHWPVAWIALDLAWTSLRWRLQTLHARAVLAGRRPPRAGLLAVSAIWFGSIGAGALGCLLIADLRMALLACFLVIGYCGYVASRWAAFPRFATLMLCLLVAGLTAGLRLSPLDGAPDVGLIAPAGAAAFMLLMRLNHDVLVGALRSQHENRRLSMHDPLTGLPNRLQLREQLAALCHRLHAGGARDRFAVMCLDLDGFKGVNDRYGHAAGDWLLKEASARLRARVRSGDIVARIGGDEFVILLPGADRETAADAARRITGAMAQPYDLGAAAGVAAGATIGIALAPDHATQAEQLLSFADDALYAAKRSAKGTWRLHG